MKRLSELDEQIQSEERKNTNKRISISPAVIGIVIIAIALVSFVFIKLFVPSEKSSLQTGNMNGKTYASGSQEEVNPNVFGSMWKDPALPENAFSIIDTAFEKTSFDGYTSVSFRYTVKNNTDIDITSVGIECAVQDAEGNICGQTSAWLNIPLPAGKQGTLEGWYEVKSDKECAIVPQRMTYDTDGDNMVVNYSISEDIVRRGTIRIDGETNTANSEEELNSNVFGGMLEDPALPENAFSIVDTNIEKTSFDNCTAITFRYIIKNKTDIDMSSLGIECAVQDAEGNICGEASAWLNIPLPAGKQGTLEGWYEVKSDKECAIVPQSITYDTNDDYIVMDYSLTEDMVREGTITF